MDAVHHHKVLQGPSVEVVTILMQYCIRFLTAHSTAAIVASSFAGVCTVCEHPAFISAMGVVLVTGGCCYNCQCTSLSA
jgi:hypothetical protein